MRAFAGQIREWTGAKNARFVAPFLHARPRKSSKLADRQMALLAMQQILSGTYATASVIAMTILVAPHLANANAVLAIAVLRALFLLQTIHCARIAKDRLLAGIAVGSSITGTYLGYALGTFVWGMITWPLLITDQLDFMTFLIVTIALFSICLAILTTSFVKGGLFATALGGTIGLLPKIVALTGQIGGLLPLGFFIFTVTTFAYALFLERQARGGVLIQLRNARMSDRLARANTAIQEALGRAQWLADRDALTELRNRRAFEHELHAFHAQFAHRQIYMMLLDVDHFKKINDRFGHGTGDGVLLAIATALRQWEEQTTGRMTGRWGGEEFIAVIALNAGESIDSFAESLRLAIAALADVLHWPDAMQLSVSIGCASLPSQAHFDQALTQADSALYFAKNAGRNCWKLAA